MMLGKAARLPFAFERRNRRPPADPINACLSLAYALLTRTMTTALATVGLDPLLGFYHSQRPGRPSLALDRMEPYRPLIADSAVLMAISNGEVKGTDFVSAAGGCNLTPTGRCALIAAYERLDVGSTHPTFGYQAEMRLMLAVQARLLVRFFMGRCRPIPTSRHDERTDGRRARVRGRRRDCRPEVLAARPPADEGVRWLQLSLFHCRLTGSRRTEMAARLDALIKPGEDHVVILDLGPAETVELAVESLGQTFERIERRAIVV